MRVFRVRPGPTGTGGEVGSFSDGLAAAGAFRLLGVSMLNRACSAIHGRDPRPVIGGAGQAIW